MRKTKINLDDILGFEFLYAINRGLSDSSDYPSASLYGNPKYVCVTVSLTSATPYYESYQKEFDRFIEVFPLLCEEHQIQPLSGYAMVASKRVPISAPELIKYEFYIDPIEFDRMMMSVSDHYRGYRHTGSILRLAFPNTEALKEGVICCFPALRLSEDHFLLRVAGCNAAETISTQIAFLLNKLKLVSYEKYSAQFYGHGYSPITQFTLPGLDGQEYLEVALSCLGLNQMMNYQAEEGLTEVVLSAEAIGQNLRPMDSLSENVYRLLGVVQPDELKNLSSIEVPIHRFMSALRDKYCVNIRNSEEVLKNYRHPDCAQENKDILIKHAEEKLNGLYQGLKNVERIMSLLEKTPLLQDSPLVRRFLSQGAECNEESLDAVIEFKGNHQ